MLLFCGGGGEIHSSMVKKFFYLNSFVWNRLFNKIWMMMWCFLSPVKFISSKYLWNTFPTPQLILIPICGSFISAPLQQQQQQQYLEPYPVRIILSLIIHLMKIWSRSESPPQNSSKLVLSTNKNNKKICTK